MRNASGAYTVNDVRVMQYILGFTNILKLMSYQHHFVAVVAILEPEPPTGYLRLPFVTKEKGVVL